MNSSEQAKKIKPTAPKSEKLKTLDELLEVLDQDELRHVVGGLRPKGKPARV